MRDLMHESQEFVLQILVKNLTDFLTWTGGVVIWLESFCLACLRVCNLDLRALISNYYSGIVAIDLDFFFLLRIFLL